MRDDFDRTVYCIAGLPFDAVDLPRARSLLLNAFRERVPCFLSTPNLNWVVACQSDAIFRDSVLQSDLNVVDGMPLIWVAKLLGIPIRQRVAGASLFEALLTEKQGAGKVFFFGGPDGVGDAACKALNSRVAGLECVGFLSPGFVSVAEMSSQSYIDIINASGADFVVVALGARKGQAWIQQNCSRIHAPVISHLGAVVNFVAGTVSRAPAWMQCTGLEWLWRIWEEPALWRRYWSDGVAFLKLILFRVLPYAGWLLLNRRWLRDAAKNCTSAVVVGRDSCRMAVSGVVLDPVPQNVRSAMRSAAQSGVPVVIDLAETQYVSPGFLGLLLILEKRLNASGLSLQLLNVAPALVRIFEWNGLGYFLKAKIE